MKIPCFLLLMFAGLVSRVSASEGVDVFRAGLQAFQINGPDALFGAWYDAGDSAQTAALRKRLVAATQNLGQALDIDVFAPRQLGRRVERLYGVIYFKRRPLWIRAEYYTVAEHSGFISLEFSVNADDILPLEMGTAPRS